MKNICKLYKMCLKLKFVNFLDLNPWFTIGTLPTEYLKYPNI